MVNSHSGPHRRTGAWAIFLMIVVGASVLGFAASGASAAGPSCPTGRAYRSGLIGTATWDTFCTWVMYGNVTVNLGATLTILPGTTVLADPSVHLYVRGTLRADGSSGGLITFGANRTGVGVGPWGGVQFNASATGSVSWASFDRVDRAVSVLGPTPSSPWIHDNTVIQAGIGFSFLTGSTSTLSSNTIRRTTSFGVYVNASSIFVDRNTINGTTVAIQLEQPGTSTVSSNTITNVSSTFAAGISVWYGATANILNNAISGVRALAGSGGPTSGSNGRDGGVALGVFVNAAPSASVSFNSIDTIIAGNGGNGAADTTVGPGGPGGRGGDAGEAAGIEVFSTATSAGVSSNSVTGLTGGQGGVGGAGTVRDGSGGGGADAYGIIFLSAAQADASANVIQTLRGGLGGNTSGALGTGNGARGGDATGISVISILGSSTVHANTIDSLTGGVGGTRGPIGGQGGNATGVIAFGNNDGLFNATSVTSDWISTLTGGQGGNGRTAGGNGGSASGIGVVIATPTLGSDTILTLQGGRGGDSTGANGGRGGDATGVIGALVADGRSSFDSITSVTKGAAGSGPPLQTSYGIGFNFLGNATFTSRFTVDNATFAFVCNYEFFVNNYSWAVSVNTPFTRPAVMPVGNLTVQNFLDVQGLWPDGFTPATGARIIIQDNGVDIWNQTAPTGDQSWILVTDRVYIGSNTAKDNVTKARVTYSSYTFGNNPRSVDMSTSHTETFTMVDLAPPTSAASALPTYENSTSFFVYYTASDGFGTGLGNITLWYRQGESVVWIKFTTQAAASSGQFAFVATSNGHYEFATTANDLSGNTQPGPTANNTWTLIDTLTPGSHVNTLPQYKNSMSFVVTWAPDTGVTDIAAYTVQYNAGSGWVNWLVGTTSTSATFTAPIEGIYAFRSIATDRAGNREVAPSLNDTYTIVDVTRPVVTSYAPTATNATRSPIIQITFSKSMDRKSVERAFNISGGVAGTFQWSSDSRSVTFLASGVLQAGTTYTVVLATTATDLAGNQMLNPLTYQFSTAAAPPSGLALSSFWWLIPILAAILGTALFLVMRRRTAATPKPAAPAPVVKAKEAIIEDVFLLNHRDGILIKHETRRLRPDGDTDILTGMLTAVQQFVKEALRGDDYADLNEMTVGHMHILIGRGKWLVLAARIEGDGSEPWTVQIERCIKDMEDHHWDQIEDWDGDMTLARVLTPYIKKLIDGAYAH